MNDTTLSIVIPVFNAEATLGRTLTSLSRIDEANRGRTQVVLIDDGSSDGSATLIKAFADAGAFGQVTCLSQSNAGVSAARNAGLAACVGRWVLLLDADDELLLDPTPLLPKDGAGTSVLFTVQLARDGRDGRKVRPRRVMRDRHRSMLTAGCPHMICALVFRRDRVDHLFDPDTPLIEDWLFWMENPGIYEHVVDRTHAILVRVHAHGTNRSRQFAGRGRSRLRIAERKLVEWRDALTPGQRNNLLLQSFCGRLQAGLPVRLFELFRVPCDPVLFLKSLAYWALRGKLARLEIYGRSQAADRKYSISR